MFCFYRDTGDYMDTLPPKVLSSCIGREGVEGSIVDD